MLDPAALPEEALGFLGERHLATLTTLRPDGSPHVVAVGFTWDRDAGLARVISFAPSRKARNLAASPGARAAVCQVDGGRWLTLEGAATVTDDPDARGGGRASLRRALPPARRARTTAVVIEIDRRPRPRPRLT